MLGRGVDVVVVGGEAGVLEFAGFDVAELAERDADFHAEFADLADGFEHGVELGIAVANAFPCGSHAEAGGAVFAGGLGDGHDLIDGHEAFFFEPGVVVGALGAVAAILAAAAGLHAEECAKLDLVFRPEFEKNTPTFLDEIEEGTVVDLLEIFQSRFHGKVFIHPPRSSQSPPGWVETHLNPAALALSLTSQTT